MQQQVLEVTNARFIPHVRALIEEGRTVRFRAMGWSMRPLIEHARDDVLLSGYGEAAPQRYDVVLAATDRGGFVLHRIVHIDGDHYTCRRRQLARRGTLYARRHHRQGGSVLPQRTRATPAHRQPNVALLLAAVGGAAPRAPHPARALPPMESPLPCLTTLSAITNSLL